CCLVLREDEPAMEDRSPRRCRTLVTQMAHRGLPANKIAGALISMMARGKKGSKQRPDTLMQAPTCHSEKSSCNARPDHTFGSFTTDAVEAARACMSALPRKMG